MLGLEHSSDPDMLPPKSREIQAPFCKTGLTLVPSTTWKSPSLAVPMELVEMAAVIHRPTKRRASEHEHRCCEPTKRHDGGHRFFS